MLLRLPPTWPDLGLKTHIPSALAGALVSSVRSQSFFAKGHHHSTSKAAVDPLRSTPHEAAQFALD